MVVFLTAPLGEAAVFVTVEDGDFLTIVRVVVVTVDEASGLRVVVTVFEVRVVALLGFNVVVFTFKIGRIRISDTIYQKNR